MDHHDAFMKLIVESPDDDAPRLVYADWLEDKGNVERAAFIRIQCELASGDLSLERRASLETQEQEFLEEFAWEWAEHLGPTVLEWQFERGFVERVQFGLERSAEDLLRLMKREPIRYLRDTAQFCHFEEFVKALPQLDRLTGLEFWWLYAFEDDLVREILESPHLKNLETLILHHDRNGNLVDEQVIIDGLKSPDRSNLVELAVNVDCSWRGPSNAILSAIADSPYLRNLKKLNLSNAGDPGNDPQLTVETIQRLAASPNLQGLEELDLRSVHATAAVWESILEMPQLSQLNQLYLAGSREVPEGHWIPVIGDIHEIPRWRDAFEERVTNIDWDQRFIDPWNGGCWTGYSWEQRCRQLLFGISKYVRNRDYDGLEAAYREKCVSLADESAARHVETLPFEEWKENLQPQLMRAIETATERGSDTIILRIRPDLDWSGAFCVHDTYENLDNASQPINLNEPFEEFSYPGPQAEYNSPAFPPAEGIFHQHGLSDGTRPSGVGQYLIARGVAAFGRCLNHGTFTQRIFFSCMHAVFRMD